MLRFQELPHNTKWNPCNSLNVPSSEFSFSDTLNQKNYILWLLFKKMWLVEDVLGENTRLRTTSFYQTEAKPTTVNDVRNESLQTQNFVLFFRNVLLKI